MMPRFDPDGYVDPRWREDQFEDSAPADPSGGPRLYPENEGGGPSEPEMDFGSFEWPSYSGPSSPNIRIGPAPQFNAPRFGAPSFEDAMNDPGYQFRARAGSDALERSAAARGVLRTGGTLKDLAEWNQNFAAQEYRNVFDRTLQGFQQNYRAAYDEFAPRFAQWQTQAGADQASALASFERQWLAYQAQIQQAMYEDERIRELAQPRPQPDVSMS